MPKKNRGRFEGGPPPSIRPSNAPARPDKGAETIRDRISNYLYELNEWEHHHAPRRGVHPVDYSGMRRKLETFKNHTPTQVLFEALFEGGVSPSVLETMATELRMRSPNGEPLRVSESEVKEAFFSESLVAQAGLNPVQEDRQAEPNSPACRRGGELWLGKFVGDQRTHKHFDLEDAYDVQQMGLSVSSGQEMRYGSDAAAITRLMFMCGHGSSERLDQVISARVKEIPGREITRENNFFEKMRNFISVYADITQLVCQSTRSDEVRDKIDRDARSTLARIIQSDEFHVMYDDPNKGPPDPFQLFQTMLLKDAASNPWVVGDCKNTPFDGDKFGLLITPDAPRGLVAEAIVGLNNYPQEILALRSRNLTAAIPLAATRLENIRELPDSTEKKKLHSEAEGAFHRQVGNLIALVHEYLQAHPSRRASYDPDIEKKIQDLNAPQRIALFGQSDVTDEPIKALKSEIDRISHDIAALTQWPSKEQMAKDNDVHPMAALLRIADPEKIVANKTIQQNFRELFVEMDAPRSPRQTAIIAASIRDVLASDDPHLFIPRLGTQDTRPLRTLLIEYANATLPRDVLRRGPYVQLDRFVAPEQPLYIPAYQREYGRDPARLADAGRHFDPAAGTDPVFANRTLMAAAEKWSEQGKQQETYEEILHFATAQAKAFYGVSDRYSVAFYRSATIAFADLLTKLIKIGPGDRVIIPNQEYNSITREFTKRGVVIGPDDIVYLNDRQSGKTYNADEMFAQFRSKVETGKIPRMIPMSLKTRLGDALCKGDPGEIRKLTARLKETYPSTVLGADLCQSFGRNDTGEDKLEQLGFDFGFNSGSKMGIDNVAALILRTRYPKGISSWLDSLDAETRKNPVEALQPRSATDSVAPIAAMAMLMQELSGNVNPWSLEPIPEGSSLRRYTAERNSRLTRYFIERAAEYSEALFSNPEVPFPVSISNADAESQRAREQFGLKVMYPLHRREAGYDGIATVALPNIVYRYKTEVPQKGGATRVIEHVQTSGAYLTKKLSEQGFPVLQCLKDYNAIRVSFRMLHDRDEINAFFAALENIHNTYLAELIKERGLEKSFSGLATGLEMQAPDASWMEN